MQELVSIVNHIQAGGGTNINSGLTLALKIMRRENIQIKLHQSFYSQMVTIKELKPASKAAYNCLKMLKQDVSQEEFHLDISKAPCFKWVHLKSDQRKTELLQSEYGITNSEKFEVLVFKLRSDYALIVATAQAEPWLRIKLDAFLEQIILGYCDNE